MKIKNIFYLLISVGMMSITACVPGRMYDDLKATQKKTADELAALKATDLTATAKLADCQNDMDQLKKKVANLQNDTAVLGNTTRVISKNYEKLNQTYDLLISKNKELMEGNVNENKMLITNYQLTQTQLQKEQDAVKATKAELEIRKLSLDKLTAELKQSQDSLQVREVKMAQLKSILNRKDSVVSALKANVTKALLGFEGNGLTVQQKNGKVYVSLEEKLLFASGSTSVDPKGAEAIKTLAQVLEKDSNINVVVEGHTDNVPYSSQNGAIKDNWDLSVLRATSIVKMITSSSKVDPKRLSASGRGEYFPIDPDNTAQARKKNRRTEIILTPKLDELLKILETN